MSHIHINRSLFRGLVAGLLLFLPTNGGVKAEPGEGIHLGPLKLSPHAGATTSVETNIYRLSVDEIAASTADAATAAGIQVNPGLAGEMASSTLEARFGYDHYLKFYPGYKDISYLDNYTLSGSLVLFPQGKLGITIKEQSRNRSFVNSSEVSLDGGASTEDIGFSDALSERLSNDTSVGLRFTPGGALDLLLNTGWYHERTTLVQDSTSVAEAPVTKNDLPLYAGARWRFFPRTALALDINFRPVYVENEEPSRMLDVQTGIEGQVTPNIQVVTKIGYGKVSSTDASVEGKGALVAQGLVAWTPIDNQTLNFTGYRTLRKEFYTDYILNSGVGLRYKGLFLEEKLELTSAVLLETPKLYVPENDDGSYDRQDQRIRFNLGAGYRMTDWLSLNGNYLLTRVNSEPLEAVTTVGPAGLDASTSNDFTQSVFSVGAIATW